MNSNYGCPFVRSDVDPNCFQRYQKRIQFATMMLHASLALIWASSRENLSSGFPKKQVSYQSPQLQRLARKSKILGMILFKKANNKGADQTGLMRRLVCAFVVRKPPKTCFLASDPFNIQHDNIPKKFNFGLSSSQGIGPRPSD